MKISEIFYSIQGEGPLAGTPSTFIRLAGCPLRCKWCDTKYAWNHNAGPDCSVNQILRNPDLQKSRFTVITGGEPMLNQQEKTNTQLIPLAQKLSRTNKHITIETAGLQYIPDLPCQLMSISPKLSNSTPPEPRLAARHEHRRLNLSALEKLIRNYNCRLKFVLDSEKDLHEIQNIISRLPPLDPQKIFLMPQAQNRRQLLRKAPMVAEICKCSGYTFGQRLQILLWQNRKAT